MRITRTRRLAVQLWKSGSVLVLGGLLTGCAGELMRFSDGFYTNAVPARPPVNVQTPYPSSAPVTQQQSVYQPSQPTYASRPAYTPQAVPGVDTYSTGSVSRQPVTAPSVARSSLPTAPQAAPVQTQASAPVFEPRPAPVQAQAPVQAAASAAASSAPRSGEGWTRTGGTYVTLRQGETVYNLAKRYGVPANAIMEANNISDASSVQAGQQMLIPMYVYGAGVGVSAPDNNRNVQSASSSTGTRSTVAPSAAPLPSTRPQTAGAAPAAAPASVAGGRYTVQSGDTLSGIARRTGTTVSALKLTNAMSSDTVRIGQTLIIPGQSGGNSSVAQVGGVDPIQTSSTQPVVAYTPPSATAPKPAAQTGSVAAIDAGQTASAPAATGIATMRWPANGRIVSSFGSNVGGRPNDGIDISVPRGTPVKAAENGVVIYSGEGLKELGKTVLVRHANGMVSVYGHLDSASVNRGDNVTRGQTIGASGMSGSAKQPQLHFEVRKDTAPVDPVKYLSKS